MRVDRRDPARTFRVGKDRSIEIVHVADVQLEPDEQVTFTSAGGTEFDVVRKRWGYYATPSLNGRLIEHGLRAVLVRDPGTGRAYLLLVEREREEEFEHYRQWDGLEIVCWLDTDEAVDSLVARLA